LEITILGKGVFSDVEIVEPVYLDFGLVYLGNSVSRAINIKNNGEISSFAFLDLSEIPSFSLDYSPEWIIPKGDELKSGIFQYGPGKFNF
jgi:hypothetical protein